VQKKVTTIDKPQSVTILNERAESLSGNTLGQIAHNLNVNLPNNLNFNKGLIGQLIEHVLGASAGNLPIPDFPQLGIELKTIPISPNNKVLETTYVCTAPIPPKDFHFDHSTVFKKLKNVLWIPYVVYKNEPISSYQFKSPIFWSPTEKQYQILRTDWEELTEMLSLGQFSYISSHIGTSLQLRPKAANSKQMIQVLDEHDNKIKIVPKGFYLRKTFTSNIIFN
jgi:DNA mismatch repair protein MutH